MKEYFIKAPSPKNGRKTFAVIERSGAKNLTLDNPIIDAVNACYLSGQHSRDYCVDQLKSFITTLKHSIKPHIPISTENIKLLDRFWKDRYEHKLDRLVDHKTLLGDYRRAIEALGVTSLVTAERETLQRTINKAVKGRKQRRIVSKLHTLLKWLGRGEVRLELDHKEQIEPKYLSVREFEQVIINADPWFKLLYQAAFWSGLRLGELFALESKSFNVNYLAVDWQIKADLSQKLPKRRKRRKAFVPEEGRAFVKQWCDLPSEEKIAKRKLSYSKLFKGLCNKTYKTPQKQLRFHDLRHSYAIYLLGRGLTIPLVAKNLGDAEEVCRECYAGFVAMDADIEASEAMIKRR